MINPLELIGRPQQQDYFGQLAMLGSNIAKQQQMQRQQAADARALALFGKDGIQHGMESQFLQEAALGSPFVQGLANRQFGAEKGLSAYQQQQMDANTRRQQLRMELNSIIGQMATADAAQMPELEAVYEEKVTEHDTLPFTASHQLWRGSPTEQRQMQAAKEMRDQKEFELSQAKGRQDIVAKRQQMQNDAIDQWRSTNKASLERIQTLSNINSQIGAARGGNVAAAKNLVAMVSRLGSNEALSDSELGLMLSQNVSDKLKGMWERFITTGSTIKSVDVANAIKVYNAVVENIKVNYPKLVASGIRKLRKVDPNTDVSQLQEDLMGQLSLPSVSDTTVSNLPNDLGPANGGQDGANKEKVFKADSATVSSILGR